MTSDELCTYKRNSAIWAHNYYEAAIFLIDNDCNGKFFPIGIANLSLSCELSLKSMIAREGKEPPRNTHKLNVLFKKFLSENQQICIIQEFPHKYSINSFSRQLMSCGNAFTEWRYLFENEPHYAFNISFLLKFAEVLIRLTD